MKYEYFISFMHDNGFGNMFVVLDKEINSKEQGIWLQEYIKECLPENKGVCMMNFVLLRVVVSGD